MHMICFVKVLQAQAGPVKNHLAQGVVITKFKQNSPANK